MCRPCTRTKGRGVGQHTGKDGRGVPRAHKGERSFGSQFEVVPSAWEPCAWKGEAHRLKK